MMKSHVGAALVLSVLALAGGGQLHAGAVRARVESLWRTTPVTIDGSSLDWPGPRDPFNDQPLSIAAVNDGDALFLVLTASDRGARQQILRRGLIVWFDSTGKDKKRFGVKFPIGVGITDDEVRGRRGGGRPPGDDPLRGAGSQGRSGPDSQSLEPPNRLEVFGPAKDDAHSFTADKAPGIEVKVAQAEALLTYELKVPLAANDAHPYAIGARPGATIGVGLEMPKLELPNRNGGGGGGRGGPGGGGMGGGRIGGGIGGRGMGGGGPRPDREGPEQQKPLNGWVTLHLAASGPAL